MSKQLAPVFTSQLPGWLWNTSNTGGWWGGVGVGGGGRQLGQFQEKGQQLVYRPSVHACVIELSWPDNRGWDLGRKTDGLKHEDTSFTSPPHLHTSLYAPLAGGPYSQGSGGLDRQSNETDHLHKDRRQTHVGHWAPQPSRFSWPRHCSHLVAISGNCMQGKTQSSMSHFKSNLHRIH